MCLALVVVACSGGGGGGGFSSGGSSTSSSSSSSVGPLTLNIHYKRIDGNYSGWGVHLWNDTTGIAAVASSTATTWTTPRPFDGVSGGWATVAIPLIASNANLNFIIHNGDAKSPMLNLHINRSTFGGDVWVVQDTATLVATQAAAEIEATRVGHQGNDIDTSAIAIGSTASALPANWNRNAQFMEIFVRSYQDSDGDGIGDIKGLISKLDYLKSLGVTGLWLMPIYKSQDHDHGYSVVDYRSIEADYGTLADFDNLMTQAHARGIGIILDYVMNHSAAQNPLFLDAVSDSANSRRNWYVFNATNLGWTGFNGTASWHASESGYYYGVFSDTMPDWNLKNQTVINYHLDNLRFWLNHGVDGFRFDAVESFIENGPTSWYNQPQNHAILLQAQTVINSYSNRYMVCEAADSPSEYAATTSCGHAFAFYHGADIKSSAISGSLAQGIVDYLNAVDRPRLPLFISNHDSFAGNRPFPDLTGHAGTDAKIAAAIEILGSDTPFTYYGEEVGMADNNDIGDSALRSPMSWTNNALNAGFTTGTPYKGLSTNVATQNVAAENGVTGSLHDWYQSLYALRNAYPVLQSGTLTLLSQAGSTSLVFLRQSGGQTAVVLINLSASSQTLNVNTTLPSTTFTDIYPTIGGSHTSTSGGNLSIPMTGQSIVVEASP